MKEFALRKLECVCFLFVGGTRNRNQQQEERFEERKRHMGTHIMRRERAH